MDIGISIIIPAYNAEDYIERCVRSVSRQTFTNLEIIIVNDGSSDNTPFILDDMAKADHRIRVIHKTNGGQGVARNVGIKIAQGKYIAFVDADDWIEQDAYEVLFSTAEQTKADIVVCSYNMAYPDGRIVCNKKFFDRDVDMSTVDINLFLQDYFYRMKIGATVWNKLYRAALIKDNDVQMPDTRIGEDFYFNLTAVVHASRISMINKPLYNYYQPVQSITRKYSKGITQQYMSYVPRYINLIKSKENYEFYYPFTAMIVYRAISNGVFNAFCLDGKLTSIYKEIKEGLNVELVESVVSNTVENKYLEVVEPKTLRISIKALFYLLNLKAVRVAAFCQLIRCRRSVSRRKTV